MDGSLSTASPNGSSLRTSPSPTSSLTDTVAHPPSSIPARDVPAGSVTQDAAGSAETLSPNIQSFLRAFVSRAIADSPEARRAAFGRARYYPGVPDSQWFDWK